MKQRPQSFFDYAHLMAKFVDALVIYFSGLITFLLYFRIPLWQWERYHWLVSLACVVGVSVLTYCGVYRSWRGVIQTNILVCLARGFAYLGALILAYLYLTKKGIDFSRLWFIWWLITAFGLCVFARIVAYWLLNKLRLKGYNLKTVALIGTKDACRELYRAVHRDPMAGFTITQVRLVDDDDAHFVTVPDIARLDIKKDVILESHEIWICVPLTDGELITNIMNVLRFSTANIRLIPDLRSFQLINHRSSLVVGHYAIDLSITPMTGTRQLIKALEDKLISIIALLLLLIPFMVISLWILIVSGRPIFYRQERVSWNGEIFKIYKFRSMPINNEKDGVQWGNAAKKETIPLGRLMRKYSIDELPQFWNVLKGDMSIVGPRPERPEFVEQFKREIPGYMQKHMVKAGITGWAQVNGWRGDTDLQQRINHDLWYIEHWSIWLDFKIIALTAWRIFSDDSAM